MTFQYALWDRLRNLGTLTDFNRTNLCQLCSHLISSSALSLAVLRVREGGRERERGRGRESGRERGREGGREESEGGREESEGVREGGGSSLLTSLQVVEFAELDKMRVQFYKHLLRSLLCDCSENTCRSACSQLNLVSRLPSSGCEASSQ